MKLKLLASLFVLLICYFFYCGFSIADESPRWNIDPRTILTPSGEYTPLPVVTNDINQFTFFPRINLAPNGVFLAYPNIRIHPTSVTQQTECPIIRSPANHLVIFASSNATRLSGGSFINSGVYVSTDGGLSWTGNDTVNTTNLNDQRGDPGPIIDKNGRFLFTHLTSLTNFGGVTGMGANYSTDNGLTWSTTFQVVNDVYADKNLGATDDSPISPFYGNSYFAWTSFSTSQATGRASRTVDGGVSWSAEVIINSTPAGHNAQGHDVAVAPNGDVFIVWAAGNSGLPFTEDFVGVAKSIDGGVSYTATENAFDINGSRSMAFNGWGIRINGFPRIAIDKSGGSRNGWIYVVTSEKFLAPADSCDVILRRSTDNGETWSSRIRVNQDSADNHKQFFSAICIDDAGNVNVVYYDNRNFRTFGDSCSVFISKSLDGGNTWTDVEIADHHFKPKAASGFGGYMGDYIGITASVGKVVAIWMDDKAGAPGFFNAWTGALEITSYNICENFSSSQFPSTSFYLESSGTNYWSRVNQSAYALGSGSVKFDFWNSPAGTTQYLTSYNFPDAETGTYLTFDRAYSPRDVGTDSLIIETSSNGGITYSTLIHLWGKSNGPGPLNTVPIISNYTPSAGNQWASMIYAIPSGTNKIRFKAKSGFGNNLYLDNICIQVLPNAFATSFNIIPEGLYKETTNRLSMKDSIRYYLHRSEAGLESVKVDSTVAMIDSVSFISSPLFPRAITGTYYIVAKHRNCIKTWSKSPGFVYTRGVTFTDYDFTISASQAYGNNMKQIDTDPVRFGIFSGDISQDGFIDASDLSLVDNAAVISLSGYVLEDVTGDGFVDASDLSIVNNNIGIGIVDPQSKEAE